MSDWYSSNSKHYQSYQTIPIFWICSHSCSLHFQLVLCCLRLIDTNFWHHTDQRSFSWFDFGFQGYHPLCSFQSRVPAHHELMLLPCHHSETSRCNPRVMTLSSISGYSCSLISGGLLCQSRIDDCLNTKFLWSQLFYLLLACLFGLRGHHPHFPSVHYFHSLYSPPELTSVWTHYSFQSSLPNWHLLSSCSSYFSTSYIVAFQWSPLSFKFMAISIFEFWYLISVLLFLIEKAFLNKSAFWVSCFFSLHFWIHLSLAVCVLILLSHVIAGILSVFWLVCWLLHFLFSMAVFLISYLICNFGCYLSYLPFIRWFALVAELFLTLRGLQAVWCSDFVVIFNFWMSARAGFERSRYCSSVLIVNLCSMQWGFVWLTWESTSSDWSFTLSLCFHICFQLLEVYVLRYFDDRVYLACASINFWTEILSYLLFYWFASLVADNIERAPFSAYHPGWGCLVLCSLCVCMGNPFSDMFDSSGRTCSIWCVRRMHGLVFHHIDIDPESL